MKRSSIPVLALAAMVASLSFASIANAEKVNLVVGSGASGGTYFTLVDEMKRFCASDSLDVSHYLVKNDKGEEVTEGGSVKNLSNLLNNKEMAGLVQLDVAALQKLQKNPNIGRLVALLPLHTEQVHIIVPTMVNTVVVEGKEGNFIGIGAVEEVREMRPNIATGITDLTNMRVASWGGSTITAQVIQLQAGINFTIIPVKDQTEAIAKMDAGEADAILAVVGAPAKWITELPKSKYKLLSAPKGIQEALASVYNVATVNYDNMGDIGQQVEAFTVPSILMTRTYKSAKMLNALTELQSCIRAKISEIQDEPGTHPAWQDVDPNAELQWDNVFKPVTTVGTSP